MVLYRTLLCLLLTCSLQARTWTATTGKTLEGEWVKSNNHTVTLRLASGKTTTFKLALLNANDQAYAKQLAQDAKHPLNWKPVTIELDEAHATIKAIGIPNAFKRIGARKWSATLPPGVWVAIRFGSRYNYDRTHVFSWSGSPALQFSRTGSRLYLRSDNSAQKLVSIQISQSVTHNKTAIKELSKYRNLDSIDISGIQNYNSKIIRQLNPKAVYVHGMIFTEEKYSELAQLPRLKAVASGGQINKLSGIRHLKHIQALYLENGLGVSNYEELSSLTNLRQLESPKGGSIRDVSWLRNMKKIESLSLSLNTSVDESEMLKHLPNLHSYSPEIGGKLNPIVVGKINNLTVLAQYNLRTNVEASAMFDLKNITYCSFLKGFDAATLNKWRDAGGLRYLRGLRWIGDPSQLKGFSSLRHLRTSVTKGTDLDHINQLITASLQLPHSGSQDFLAELLVKQKRLLNLELRNGRMTSIKELPSMPQLKVMTLDNCHQLTSLRGTEKFPALEIIILRNCKKVTDYANLQGSAKIVLIETS